MNWSKSCAHVHCQLPPLSAFDGRIEIKAVLPSEWSTVNKISGMCVRWKPNGEAVFHVQCWSAVLRMARRRGSGSRNTTSPPSIIMKRAEKLMVMNAAKTLEMFDSLEDIRRAAKTAADVIQKAQHCIAFTGAGISTSAGLGDFRGKSGKWTEQDQSAMDGVIQAAFQMDTPGIGASSSEEPTIRLKKRGREDETETTPTSPSTSDLIKEESLSVKQEQIVDGADIGSCSGLNDPPLKQQKCEKDHSVLTTVKKEPSSSADERKEEPEETVDYENLRPTFTHEALTLLMDQGLLHYVISQNCDGLHLLSGISPDCISELHGNVFMEKCPRCDKRYSRNFYVLNDEANQYYEELEDYGETEMTRPKFASQCNLCGLCHRTGRRCEEKGCSGYLEDTIINFRDNLEDTSLDRAWEESDKSDVTLCLGTTLMVTPACDLVEEATGKKALIICNRQKTAKDDLAKVRVFGDCDIFMREVLAQLIKEEDRKHWEEKRGDRMKEYNLKRKIVHAHSSENHLPTVPKKCSGKNKSKKTSKK